MKIDELSFDIPEMGRISLRGVDCLPEEFKELLEVVVELQKMEVEKAKIYSDTKTVLPVKEVG